MKLKMTQAELVEAVTEWAQDRISRSWSITDVTLHDRSATITMTEHPDLATEEVTDGSLHESVVHKSNDRSVNEGN